MKATSYYSAADKVDIVTLEVDERDRAMALNSREIMADVRRLIAQEIVSRLMVKLGPILDAAIGEAKSARPPSGGIPE